MSRSRPLNLAVLLIVLGAVTLAAALLSVCLGAQQLPIRQVVRVLFRPPAPTTTPAIAASAPAPDAAEFSDETAWGIVLSRLPRTALALLVGAALAVSGMVMQGLFQNPMADPYLLGVSSGAALGATVGLVVLPKWLAAMGALAGASFFTRMFAETSLVSVLAFVGALAVTVVVYALSRVGGRTSVTTLLLTGIAIGSLAWALSAYIYIRQPDGMQNVMWWLMGSFQRADGPRVLLMGVLTVFSVGVAALFCRDLNVMLLGDETAQHLGVEVERVRRVLLAVASLLAAAAVAVVGVIGFVGLVVPHVMRLLTGPQHERLLPACVLGGGSLTLLADVLARGGWTEALFGRGGFLHATEIPIGIVTAFVGCPFFLYLLRRSRHARH